MGALIALPVAFEQAVARAVVRNCPIYFVSSFSARAPGGRSFFLTEVFNILGYPAPLHIVTVKIDCGTPTHQTKQQ